MSRICKVPLSHFRSINMPINELSTPKMSFYFITLFLIVFHLCNRVNRFGVINSSLSSERGAGSFSGTSQSPLITLIYYYFSLNIRTTYCHGGSRNLHTVFRHHRNIPHWYFQNIYLSLPFHPSHTPFPPVQLSHSYLFCLHMRQHW